MTSLRDFQDYLELPAPAVPGVSASGIVTVTRRNTQSRSIISIPANTVFSVNTGQSFENPERAELNQSQTFIPLLLQSVATGARQNIQANARWNTPIDGINLSNTNAFEGGKDALPELNPLNNYRTQIIKRFNNPSDKVLQRILNHSEKTCLNMIGKTTAPDTDSFDNSVYFLGRYILETRSKEGYQGEGEVSGVYSERVVNPGIGDDKIHLGVMRVLIGMLAGDRDVTAFMPEVSNDSS